MGIRSLRILLSLFLSSNVYAQGLGGSNGLGTPRLIVAEFSNVTPHVHVQTTPRQIVFPKDWLAQDGSSTHVHVSSKPNQGLSLHSLILGTPNANDAPQWNGTDWVPTAFEPALTKGDLTGSSPISLSATRQVIGGAAVVSIADAVADGATKGAASFAASDFDAATGNISIDYTNGQAASGTLKGFLTSANWTTFNNKQAAGDYITALTGEVTATGPGSVTATIANDAVTYAKMQNVSATDKVLGRSSVGAGDVEEISTTGSGNVARVGSPTFTGTVTIPTPFTLGTVSVLPTGTELNYVDGVTSAIQTQLDGKEATLTKYNLAGTTNQITLSASGTGAILANNITLSLPQDIATTSTPQFARIGLGAAADATAAINVSVGDIIAMKFAKTASGTAALTSSGGYWIFLESYGVRGTTSTDMYLGAGNTDIIRMLATGHVEPASSGVTNFGNATNYWNDISYKTLTDRAGTFLADKQISYDMFKNLTSEQGLGYCRKLEDRGHQRLNFAYLKNLAPYMIDTAIEPAKEDIILDDNAVIDSQVTYDKFTKGQKIANKGEPTRWRKRVDMDGKTHISQTAEGLELTAYISHLTGALRACIDKIEILEAKVTALENK